MRVLAYGEDALTYWALTERLEEFLSQVGDETVADDVVVIYRPSFGRRGGAQFGEFDAIVLTGARTIFVESKWDSSSEFDGSTVILRPEQVRRHRILRWLVEGWTHGGSWKDFVDRSADAYALAFDGMHLAPPRTRLAENLQYLLDEMTRRQRPVDDVVLYLHREGSTPARAVEPMHFKLVNVAYPVLHGANFIEINGGS